MQMVCPAGNAVLTPDARGFYQVTLGVRELPQAAAATLHWAWNASRGSDDSRRGRGRWATTRPGPAPCKTTDLRPGRSAAQLPSDWIKLMDNVSGLEVAYFDARLNGWVDRWTDPRALPNLVRVRLGTKVGHEEPYEIVERVPGGGDPARGAQSPTTRAAPNFNTPGGTTPPGLGGKTGLPSRRAGLAQFHPAPAAPEHVGSPPVLTFPALRPTAPATASRGVSESSLQPGSYSLPRADPGQHRH